MEKLKRWVEVQIIYYKDDMKNASSDEEREYFSAKIEALESVLNEIEILKWDVK